MNIRFSKPAPPRGTSTSVQNSPAPSPVTDAPVLCKGGACTPSAAACHLPFHASSLGSSPGSPPPPFFKVTYASADFAAIEPRTLHLQASLRMHRIFPFDRCRQQHRPYACILLRSNPFLPSNRPPRRHSTRHKTHRRLPCPQFYSRPAPPRWTAQAFRGCWIASSALCRKHRGPRIRAGPMSSRLCRLVLVTSVLAFNCLANPASLRSPGSFRLCVAT